MLHLKARVAALGNVALNVIALDVSVLDVMAIGNVAHPAYDLPGIMLAACRGVGPCRLRMGWSTLVL